MKKITFLLLFIGFFGFSQSNLNGYKYVIIPKKFDFLKSEDKYQLNSLTKFLFEKQGFVAVFDNEKFPAELSQNPCLGVKADVRNESNMFSTKLLFDLTDCSNEVVFTSNEGKSKEKDYKKGYHQALRKAFESVKGLNYQFDANQSKQQTVEATPKVPSTPTVTPSENTSPNDQASTAVTENSGTTVLYAQKLNNGFQLVDSTPKIVFKALESKDKKFYYLENHAGILYQKDGDWYAEYYKNGVLTVEKLNIKF